MGLSKTEQFTRAQNDLAMVAKAIGHPARVAILEFLAKKNSCMCGDIVDELPLSQSTVSQHLKELKNAGLIRGEIEGPGVCYCIELKAWMKAKKALAGLFEICKDPNCC